MSLVESNANCKSSIDEEEDILSNISDIAELKHSVIVPISESYDEYYLKEKKTIPFITKFEKAKLLGIRAEMISNSSPVLVNVPKNITDSYKIALLEYKEHKIPLIIRRYFPNGDHEDWKFQDLILI